MTIIRCACGLVTCRVEAWVDSGSGGLWTQNNEGRQQLMYLDANSIVLLIGALREELNRRVSEGPDKSVEKETA